MTTHKNNESYHGTYGTYYLTHLTISFDLLEKEYYKPIEYDFNGLKQVYNIEQLTTLLEEYYVHNKLYNEYNLDQHINDNIESFLTGYLNQVNNGIRKLYGTREFINLEDITFTPRDYVTSILSNPNISEYYETNKDEVEAERRKAYIENAFISEYNTVLAHFKAMIDANIANRVLVTWEVPHSIYKSSSSITDEEINNGSLQPIGYLTKYENEFLDTDVEFGRRMFYRIVEHLPAGDIILPDEAEFYIPYPYIKRKPVCSFDEQIGTIDNEYLGIFKNPIPKGRHRIGCDSESEDRHIIHGITHLPETTGFDGTFADTDVAVLSTGIGRHSDRRDYAPPRIKETDEWYTEEKFGEYPENVQRDADSWWKPYRDTNMTTPEQWHDFWKNSMFKNKDDLVWYINTYVEEGKNYNEYRD